MQRLGAVMAKRGMLPKFRPATLGRDASARPSIRPVRPSPPPPPPSPPRRVTAAPLSNVAAFPAPATERDDDRVEMPTVTGHVEPATLTRGPETVPFEQATTLRRQRPEEVPQSFEDETQARAVDNGLLDKLRRGAETTHTPAAADLGVAYESLPSLEVRHPYDTYEGEFSERDPVTQLHAEGRGGHEHESASVRRAKDASAYDAPAYREPSYSEPAYGEPSYGEPSYPAPAPSYAHQDADVWGRREDSGPRSRPVPPAASSYAAPAPAYDDASISAQWGRDRAEPSQQGWPEPAPQNDVDFEEPMIPPTPRLPEEMHPAFVVGVQPIRTATPDAWGTPHAMAPQQGQYVPAQQSPLPPYPVAQQPQAYYPPPQPHYTQPPQQLHQPAHAQHVHPSAMPSQPAGSYLQQSGPHARDPRYMTPMHASGMSRGLDSVRGPMSAQLDPPAASKVGRFAWFVAGAAFGITFACFATGFFDGSPAPKGEFPAAPMLTAPVATVAPIAPPAQVAQVAQVAPPVAQPFQAAPLVAAMAPPMQAAVPAAAPIPTFAAAALPAAPPVAARPAPPPVRPRFQAPPPRRPAPPVSQAPKNLGGGGAGGDDERAPAPSAPSGDIGDLLGAGLKP